ncbi:NAD-dependent succinate-semialdehyde dehydrogenase [Corynebacterium camporealensis]
MSTFALQNPNTGTSEEEFTRIDDSERDGILERSTEAFKSWRQTTIDERAAILNRTADIYEEQADQLAEHIGREMGKLTRWAKAEVQIVVDIYRWYAEHAHELLADEHLPAQGADHTFVRKEPLGPLLGVMPWNFPYYQVARFAAPNLLLGNTIVLKHASICPLSSQACQDILEQAGLPEDVYINVYASGSQMDDFVADSRIKGVSLTGSEGAGSAVAKTAGENYKKSVLELGGNDPFLVIDDENLQWVLDQFALIRMYNTGQACNAPKRLIVLEDFYDRTVEYLEKVIGDMKVGPYNDEDAAIGPLSSIEARDEIVERLDKAKEEGTATIRVGGNKVDRDGAYMEPTLLTDVDPNADIGCNEIFGPVAVIYKAKDVNEAIEIANNSDYGLSSSVWSTDIEAATKVATQLQDGMTFVNEHAVTGAGLPFGGINRSGYGRELARWGVGEFVNEHLYRVSDQSSPGLSPAS